MLAYYRHLLPGDVVEEVPLEAEPSAEVPLEVALAEGVLSRFLAYRQNIVAVGNVEVVSVEVEAPFRSFHFVHCLEVAHRVAELP